ncbi:carboxypeptidase-like regulatory domain-containing protein [Patescibacteria group bacterium]|nr:carboxypeptidase-like regulatory domain-containing protein [Patescibacteria group bacterium]
MQPTQPTVRVIWPNGWETLENGHADNLSYNIMWESTGAEKINIELLNTATNSATTIASNITASLGKYNWFPNSVPAGNYKITISYYRTSASGVADSSDASFSVVAPPPPTTIYCQQLYAKIQASWNKSCGQTGYDAIADIDKDGKVSYSDLAYYAPNRTNQIYCQQKLEDTTNPCVTSYSISQNQLGSISDAINRIMEQIKDLFK